MKKQATEAIKAAVANAKRPNRYPGIRCQGMGGICPNLATHKTAAVPGGYCEICMAEVERTLAVMRKYVADRGLFNQEEIIAKLEGMGFIAHKVTRAESKKELKREMKLRKRVGARVRPA